MLVKVKGSSSSGWFSPPKGTHSGEKHVAVGSGKATAKEQGFRQIGEKSRFRVTEREPWRDKLYGYAADGEWEAWRDGLSEEEIDAYLLYSTKKVKVGINEQLRGKDAGRSTKRIETAVGNIDATMRDNPIPVEVHRFVDIPTFYKSKWNRMEVGDSFTDNGYTSTSLVKQDIWDSQPMIVRVAKGVKVAYLAEMNDGDKRPVLSPRWAKVEQELLIHRGATFTKVGMQGTTPIFEIRE